MPPPQKILNNLNTLSRIILKFNPAKPRLANIHFNPHKKLVYSLDRHIGTIIAEFQHIKDIRLQKFPIMEKPLLFQRPNSEFIDPSFHFIRNERRIHRGPQIDEPIHLVLLNDVFHSAFIHKKNITLSYRALHPTALTENGPQDLEGLITGLSFSHFLIFTTPNRVRRIYDTIEKSRAFEDGLNQLLSKMDRVCRPGI